MSGRPNPTCEGHIRTEHNGNPGSVLTALNGWHRDPFTHRPDTVGESCRHGGRPSSALSSFIMFIKSSQRPAEVVTGVLQTFWRQGVQGPRSPIWQSKRPAQLGDTKANGSCHDVVVATNGVPLPQEMPQNKGFGLTSTFMTILILLMGCPVLVRHRPGWSSQLIHRAMDFTQSQRCLQNSSCKWCIR